MSCSPQVGHETIEILVPSIQKAGHSPLPTVSFIRASMRPYSNCCNPCVFIRVEVHVPFWFLIARITRFPFPSMNTFGLEAVQGAVFEPAAQYTSSSALPQPPPPTSKVQFV